MAVRRKLSQKKEALPGFTHSFSSENNFVFIGLMELAWPVIFIVFGARGAHASFKPSNTFFYYFYTLIQVIGQEITLINHYYEK